MRNLEKALRSTSDYPESMLDHKTVARMAEETRDFISTSLNKFSTVKKYFESIFNGEKMFF